MPWPNRHSILWRLIAENRLITLTNISTTINTDASAAPRCLLIICPTDTWGGVEKNVLLRASAMAKRGHRVIVVLVKNTFEEKFSGLPEITVETINSRPSDLSPLLYWRYLQLIKRYQPDCVFVPIKKDWWAATVTSRWAKVPNVVLYLGIMRRIKQNIKYRLILNRFKALVIVNSQDLKQHLLNSNRYFNSQNLKLIYNGFYLPDLDLPGPDLRTALQLPQNAIVIGCAGRFSRQKGFDHLPDIVNNLPEHIHVVVAGGGKLQPQIEQLIADSELSHRIHLIGPQQDMTAFYRTLDLFLLLSRNEGMANVLNEALSFGLPAISTQVPGSTELLGIDIDNPHYLLGNQNIMQGEFGLMTAINDTQALTAAVQAVLTGQITFDPAKQRGKIRRDHDLNIMMNLTEQIFFGLAPDEQVKTTHHKATQ
ncbi:MAG: glycosyltransferase [Natronospirillum sp.]